MGNARITVGNARMTKQKRILVIGDWLVDEHWVVGRHRSESASRPGQRHSRALQAADCSVRSLCGAGQVATVLHNAFQDKHRLFDITGVGLWHDGDEDQLRLMLEPQNNIGNTPYCLVSSPGPHSVPFVRLLNIAPKKLRSHLGTTRVIRVYEQTRYEVALRDRVDWERELSADSWSQINRGLDDSLRAVPDLEKLDAVVIKNLAKGVVTPRLIDIIKERAKKAEWYVSSKDWNPAWYDNLPHDRVKLVLIPQIAAWKAIRHDVVRSSTWLTIAGSGSKEAFSAVQSISDKFSNALIVVLPDGMTMFARSPTRMSGRPIAITQTKHGNPKHLSVLPMASVFFPALVSNLVGKAKNNVDYGKALGHAINYTDHWMRQEYRRVIDFDWKPSSEQNLDLSKKYDQNYVVKEDPGWDRSQAHWIEATSKNGVVQYRGVGAKKLQLWRAMTDVSGYVACLPDKRLALKRLIEQGRQFNRERSRHMSYMLMDKPGSGKSYLVKCLARQLNVRLLEFNITQMLERGDVIAMFDKIITEQAQNPDERLLVFVDEINAKLDGEHVYSSFLAPLEDGIYVRGGNPFHIHPCFWIFAGTKPPKHPGDHLNVDEDDKGSDFQSRLTLDPFPLWVDPRDTEHMDAASLEKVYIAAATIQRFFPDVQRISSAALAAFELLPASIAPRAIARLVKTFQNVQYGRVGTQNLPPRWHAECEIDPTRLTEWEDARAKGLEGDDIIIESNPGYELMQERNESRSSRAKSPR